MMDWLVIFSDLEPLNPDPHNKRLASRRDRVLYWFLNRFLKPGFRHVHLMRLADEFNGWIMVNPHSCCMDILEYRGRDYFELCVLPLIKQGAIRVLKVQARRPGHWIVRPTFSCVSIVAHILGVECGVFFTPWRLYKKLDNIIKTEGLIMGGVFGGGDNKPDTSAADAERARLKAERDELDAKNKATLKNRKSKGRGRSLLMFDETGAKGVQNKLGG